MPTKKATKSTAKKSPAAKKSTSSKSKKAASPKIRTASKSKAKSQAGDQEVTIDRRHETDRRDEATEESVAALPKLEKREKVQRRRQIDPTTCERDYSDVEVEFMSAMDEYKRTSGRMFPTCSEVLEVIRELGYVQLTLAERAIVRPEPIESIEEGASTEDGQDEFENAELETEELETEALEATELAC